MRFRLSSLLAVVTFVAVFFALGHQVYVLQQQVSELRKQVQTLQQRPPMVVIGQPQRVNSNSPFKLLNADLIVNPSVERGMKADEWERARRMERRLEIHVIPAPDLPSDGLGRQIR